MLMSLKHSNTNKSAAPPEVAPPTPAAFAHKKSTFAPPPVRHVSATSPPPSRSASTVESPAPAPPVPPSRRAPAKEEPQGEWAEALYDYSSEVGQSLSVLFLSKLSILFRIQAIFSFKRMNGCSWLKETRMTGQCSVPCDIYRFASLYAICRWTGEIEGRRGLFPAAYVKLL